MPLFDRMKCSVIDVGNIRFQISYVLSIINAIPLFQSMAIGKPILNHNIFFSLNNSAAAETNKTIRPISYAFNEIIFRHDSSFPRTQNQSSQSASASLKIIKTWYKNTSSGKRYFLKRTKRRTTNNCIKGYVVKRIQNHFQAIKTLQCKDEDGCRANVTYQPIRGTNMAVPITVDCYNETAISHSNAGSPQWFNCWNYIIYRMKKHWLWIKQEKTDILYCYIPWII